MKITTYILLLLFTLLSIGSCSKKEKDTEHKHQHEETAHEEEIHKEGIHITQAQFDAAKMALGGITTQNFPEVVKTTGMIDVPPQSKEIITSFYGGYIKKSNLIIGDKVRKGQAVATLENPIFVDMQQEYLETKEQLTYLKSEYDRQKTLFDEKITSEKKYLKAQSAYNQKKATYSGLRKKLQMLNITIASVEQGDFTTSITLFATIGGSITKINVSKGTPISPADEIMEIVNTDHIHIELMIFEKDALRIKKGQEIQFKIPEASDKIYDAEVHLVGRSIDEKDRTIKVHGHLHHETKNVFDIGMFVEGEIQIKNKETTVLPESAILEDGEHTVVLKLENRSNGTYAFEPIEVKIGKTHNGYTEVFTKNIKPTDKVLVKGGYALVGAESGGHSH